MLHAQPQLAKVYPLNCFGQKFCAFVLFVASFPNVARAPIRFSGSRSKFLRGSVDRPTNGKG
jgi:hypothetical protein